MYAFAHTLGISERPTIEVVFRASLGHALPMNPLAFSRAQQDSVALHERFKGDPQVFHVVACSYDTDFEPLGTQIEKKCAEIESVFSHPETIEVVLHLVDDTLDAGIMNAAFKTRFVKVRRKAYKDTNGPMKVFNERAARALVRHARINDVGLDVEWLMIWLRAGCKVKRFGLYWQQRAGSHPPWSKTAMMLADLARLRRHFGP